MVQRAAIDLITQKTTPRLSAPCVLARELLLGTRFPFTAWVCLWTIESWL
jgi:hypothetical protein